MNGNVLKRLRGGPRVILIFGTALLLTTVASVQLIPTDIASAAGSYHTVTFAENDSPSDAVYATQTEDAPTALTAFSSLSPSFSNSGYTFVDWNTEADGDGVSYADGSLYDFDSAMTLYAVWRSTNASLCTITFSSNAGTGSVATMTGSAGSSINLPSGSTLAYAGYTFVGWSSSAAGSGTTYAAGATYQISEDVTLYAQWAPDVYVVTLDADGGTVSPSVESYTVGGAALVLPTPTNSALSFSGWFSAESGGTLVAEPGATYEPTTSVTLYAQWGSSSSVVLSFQANGGSGAIASISGVEGASVSLPGSTGLVRSGYTLSSWNTEANGSGTDYALGASITLSTSVTLYAQWTSSHDYALYGAVGLFRSGSATLSSGLKDQIVRLAKAIKSRHYTGVSLYGYTAATGLVSLNRSISERRALNVADFLRSTLAKMKVRGVDVRASGEGAIGGKTSPAYSRVEVFVL